MERTDAPDNDLDLTIAGPADPVDALQVDPQDVDALSADPAAEPAPEADADGVIDLAADTPFEMIEDEYTPTPLVGDPIAAILASDDDGSVLPQTDDAIAADASDVDSPESDIAVDPIPADEAPAETESAAAPVLPPVPGRTGAWWTLPLIFAGVGVLACALLVPAADENRRAMYDLAKIERDVAYFERQSEVNREFLERVSSDPTLAERLAMRQLRMTREDAKIAPLPTQHEKYGMSPFALVTIDPPPAIPEYRPIGGLLGKWFSDAQRQMYFCGAGLLMIATGLICGGGTSMRRTPADEAAE